MPGGGMIKENVLNQKRKLEEMCLSNEKIRNMLRRKSEKNSRETVQAS
jgi:hypothetical protein